MRNPIARARALALCASLFLVAALPRAAAGQEPAADAAEASSESEQVQEAEGSALDGLAEDYEELEQLEQLEAQALQPAMVGDEGPWRPELLAPYQGVMASARRDAGLIHELRGLPEAAPRGAALCDMEAVRERLAAATLFGEPIPVDEPGVRAHLDFFDGRGKGLLARWLGRMGRYEPMIRQVLREEGLPEDLLYVAMIESGFSPTARSPAAATGVWQFIASTGREMGLKINRHVDERRDPIKATRAAARYLKWLYERYDSWPLALAAYNGGLGMIDREIDRHNSNDYWFIRRHEGMYQETRRYVPRIMAAAIIAKHRDVFGLASVEPAPAWDFDLVEVENPTRLTTLAEAVGVELEALRDLNPELRAAATPPTSGGRTYTLRIPAGTAKEFVARFDELDPDEQAHQLHRVAIGESVELIAAHYGVKPRVLRALNGLGKRARFSYGVGVIIPETMRGSWEPPKSKERPIVFIPEEAITPESMERRIYAVNPGDDLEILGRAFRLNPADIALWNALDPGAKLHDGMHLQLFFASGAAPETLALQPDERFHVVAMGSEAHQKLVRKRRAKRRGRRRYHRVRPGESIWLIARRYRTTVKRIKRLNPKLRRSNTLQPGDRIRVR